MPEVSLLNSAPIFQPSLGKSSKNQKQPLPESSLLVTANMSEAYGHVSLEKVKKFFLKLKEKAAFGVIFEENRLESYCSGGTCSAQSLNFLNLYFQSNQKNLHKRIVSVAKKCLTSSETLRTWQVALNSIAKDPNVLCSDFSKAKVESIVALQDLEIDYASESLKNENGFIEQDLFEKTVENLPEGVYFTRLLATQNNYKGEIYGHSVLFFNFKNEGQYFWDPLNGLEQLNPQKAPKVLYEAIGGISSRWGLDDPRFYRVHPIDKKGPATKGVSKVKHLVTSYFR